MANKRKPITITELLRREINNSPLSFNALEKESGVLRQILMKFARGESDIRLETADKLAAYFGLKITKQQDSDNG